MKNRRWEVFKVDEIFDMFTGASISRINFSSGQIPRITATDMNNGIGLFTDSVSDKNYRLFSNFISVSFLGSIFYHEYEASLDMKIHGLRIKNCDLNPSLAQFLITCLKNSLPKVSYGNQLSSKDLATKSILLPVDDSGTPDWIFMEKYVLIKSNQINDSFKLPDQYIIKDNRELNEVEWKEFFLSEIFETPRRGKRITSSNYIEGNIPVVSSAGGNNGVISFAGNEEHVRKFKNCLSVANGGVSAGYTFYHPYEFIATDHVTQLESKFLNKFHYLFISTMIKNQTKEKYHFSREMTELRLKREKILLPIDKDSKPNFCFMEQYMKRMENKVIAKRKRVYENRHSTGKYY